MAFTWVFGGDGGRNYTGIFTKTIVYSASLVAFLAGKLLFSRIVLLVYLRREGKGWRAAAWLKAGDGIWRGWKAGAIFVGRGC